MGFGLTIHYRISLRVRCGFHSPIFNGAALATGPAVPNLLENRIHPERVRQMQALD
jgi:hypothetical protein